MKTLENKKILVTGGTGSLGKTLIGRILRGDLGIPAQITVFSRDEAKQHFMRLEFLKRKTATDEVIYQNHKNILKFRIGDVRDFSAISAAVRDAEVIFHAAALKQVPSCEYFPFEAVLTNIYGSQNLVNAVNQSDSKIETLIGISTDKACKPINVMGMTKAIQERILVEANNENNQTDFLAVRYGNVIASRGSIIPLFIEQISQNQPITITLPEMTRFLLSLDQAVDTVFAAYQTGQRGDTFIPQIASAKITDVAKALMGDRQTEIKFTGIRPGEKVHEIMVSEEECFRTTELGNHYVIKPVLPELRGEAISSVLTSEYSSKDNNISVAQLKKMFENSKSEIESYTDQNS